MKKFYSFLFAAVALVGFAACNSDSTEEPAPAQENVGKMEFTANIGEDTKTALDGLNVTWCEGDIIGIWDGTATQPFTATEINGKSAKFEGMAALGQAKYYAVYPYVEGATCADGVWTGVNFNNNQEAVIGTFACGANISFAEAEGTHLTFTNSLAVLKFQVPVACKLVEFVANNALLVKAWGTDENKMQPEKDYYVTVPAGEYKLTARVDGYLSVASTKTLEVATNKIYNLKTLPAPVESDWGIKGAFTDGNNWNTHVKMYKETESLFVVKNVQGKDKDFKITDGNTWLGGDFALLNKWCNTFDGPNLKLPAEKCDIYFDINEKIFCIVEAGTKVPEIPYLYLNVEFDGWFSDNARFAVCFMNDDKLKQHWYSFNGLTKENRIGSVPCFGGYKYVVFCRMNGRNSTNNWGNRWNQTQDEVIPANGNNMVTITGWDNYSWSKK
ncbi:MAG: hypothetical protein E7137_00725 [Rikenellaceae bacterium]|nr:hypothetical protein [Rikenellaceae bacterium]